MKKTLLTTALAAALSFAAWPLPPRNWWLPLPRYRTPKSSS
jgi:hypothetical protein